MGALAIVDGGGALAIVEGGGGGGRCSRLLTGGGGGGGGGECAWPAMVFEAGRTPDVLRHRLVCICFLISRATEWPEVQMSQR